MNYHVMNIWFIQWKTISINNNFILLGGATLLLTWVAITKYRVYEQYLYNIGTYGICRI